MQPHLRGVSAQACDRCARSCDQFGDAEQMKACAKMSRQCAESCRQMAGMKTVAMQFARDPASRLSGDAGSLCFKPYRNGRGRRGSAQAHPCLDANSAAWVRSANASLLSMPLTWNLAVFSLIDSFVAISLLLSPRPKRANTSRSRAVNRS